MPYRINPITGKFDYYEPGVSGDVETRLETLEDNYIKIAYYAEITTTSGIISPPAGAEILLDQWSNGVDAIIFKIVGGKPDFQDSGVDVLSFDISGNYTLSAPVPSNPAALVYYFRIKSKDWDNLDIEKIIEYAEIKDAKRIMYQAYDTIGGQDINQITPVPITLPTVNINSSGYFTFISTTQIRINKGGTYNLSYKIGGGDNVTNRRDLRGGIRLSGTQILEQSIGSDYVRNSSNNEFTISCPPYSHVIAAGTIIELVGFRVGDAGQALTALGYSWLKLEFINI